MRVAAASARRLLIPGKLSAETRFMEEGFVRN
jgi:hypothetical protein